MSSVEFRKWFESGQNLHMTDKMRLELKSISGRGWETDFSSHYFEKESEELKSKQEMIFMPCPTYKIQQPRNLLGFFCYHAI